GTDLASARTAAQIFERFPNLASPEAGSGVAQTAARRALWAHGGTATTAQVAAWAYARKLLMLKRRLGKSDYRQCAASAGRDRRACWARRWSRATNPVAVRQRIKYPSALAPTRGRRKPGGLRRPTTEELSGAGPPLGAWRR